MIHLRRKRARGQAITQLVLAVKQFGQLHLVLVQQLLDARLDEAAEQAPGGAARTVSRRVRVAWAAHAGGESQLRCARRAVSGDGIGSLQKLDPTLVDAAGLAVPYQVSRLQKRAAKAELRRARSSRPPRRANRDPLYPHKTLQEREIGGLYFYAKYGPELIERLINLAQARCPEHKVMVLGS